MKYIIIGQGRHSDVIMDTIYAMKTNKCTLNLDYNDIDIEMIRQFSKNNEWFVAIGDNTLRKTVVERIEGHGIPIKWATIIHPRACYVSHTAVIGEGTYIGPGAVVGVSTFIGKHCIINTGATCDHHNKIRHFAHVAPGCHLCGRVTVDEECRVGAGTTVVPNVGIHINIRAHSCIVNDILK